MQPVLPSLQEENQSEPVSPLEEILSETISTPEVVQPEQAPVQEESRTQPTPSIEKKHSKSKLPVILSRLFVIALVLAVTGLGYWAYTLNTKLVETQQQLATLQGEHGKLESAYASLIEVNTKLIANLAQSKSDLEKANTDLADMQKEAKKWETVSKDLDIKIDKASRLTEVLYAWSTIDEASDIMDINALIRDSGDELLIKQWESLGMSPSDETLGKFMNYLVRAIRTSLQ